MKVMNEQIEYRTTTFSTMKKGDLFLRENQLTVFVFLGKKRNGYNYGEKEDETVTYNTKKNREVKLIVNQETL